MILSTEQQELLYKTRIPFYQKNFNFSDTKEPNDCVQERTKFLPIQTSRKQQA